MYMANSLLHKYPAIFAIKIYIVLPAVFLVTNRWVILKLLKEHNAAGLILLSKYFTTLRRKMHVIHQN